MSKSQSRELFACDETRAATAGLSLLTAVAGPELFSKDKNMDFLLKTNTVHTDSHQYVLYQLHSPHNEATALHASSS